MVNVVVVDASAITGWLPAKVQIAKAAPVVASQSVDCAKYHSRTTIAACAEEVQLADPG